MKIVLIAGGTGLVGTLLSKKLAADGYEVRWLSREKLAHSKYPTFLWNVEKGVADANAFKDVDVIINLSGAGVADKLWSEKRKKEITQSRVQSNQLLSFCFKNYHKPKLYLSAGAIGYYGNRKDEWLSEDDEPGSDFLSESCQLWEKSIFETKNNDLRLVIFRIGIVLSTKAGALQKMLLPWKMGLSTSFNPGNQWYSWIHEEDLVNLFAFAIKQEDMHGIYNAVSPNPVTMKSFAIEMKNQSTLPWRSVFSFPYTLIQLAMGEMSSVLTNSVKVSAKKITQTGFTFKFPTLDAALKNLIG